MPLMARDRVKCVNVSVPPPVPLPSPVWGLPPCPPPLPLSPLSPGAPARQPRAAARRLCHRRHCCRRLERGAAGHGHCQSARGVPSPPPHPAQEEVSADLNVGIFPPAVPICALFSPETERGRGAVPAGTSTCGTAPMGRAWSAPSSSTPRGPIFGARASLATS